MQVPKFTFLLTSRLLIGFFSKQNKVSYTQGSDEMNYLFIEYPPCSTCRNAKKHLDQQGIQYTSRHIVEDTPTINELKEWIALSNLDIKKFFNTSGNVYKQLQLKDKLDSMSNDEKISLLASNGMLIKRPLLISKDKVILGYHPDTYNKVR